jgi:hypothetical protein
MFTEIYGTVRNGGKERPHESLLELVGLVCETMARPADPRNGIRQRVRMQTGGIPAAKCPPTRSEWNRNGDNLSDCLVSILVGQLW